MTIRNLRIVVKAQHYNYYRDYDPGLGRYLESDPEGLRGGLNTYGYVYAQPLVNADPSGRYAEMCQRPVQVPLVPGQHCFVRFNGDNGDTMSFDPKGVHPDPSPGNANCRPTQGDPDDDCVKREMKKCKDYSYTKNNCCHCVEQALKACKLYYPPKDYPNWPINPGPLPGEPGGK